MTADLLDHMRSSSDELLNGGDDTTDLSFVWKHIDTDERLAHDGPEEPSDGYAAGIELTFGMGGLWATVHPTEGQQVESQACAIQDAGVLLKQAADELERLQLDARRYRRLRILGVAPCNTSQLEGGTVIRFQSLDAFVDDDLEAHESRGEHPGEAPSGVDGLVGRVDRLPG